MTKPGFTLQDCATVQRQVPTQAHVDEGEVGVVLDEPTWEEVQITDCVKGDESELVGASECY
jgi:hypothetical protein